MIPEFDDAGQLPPGIFVATLDEINIRFGLQSEIRRVQMESIRWLVQLAAKADVQRIILNGSFVCNVNEPNDVDCILLVPAESSSQSKALKSLRAGLPFLGITIVAKPDFDVMVNLVFGTDRLGRRKGMVEVAQ